MKKDFNRVLTDWETKNKELWKEGINFGLNQASAGRVEAFISCVLQENLPKSLQDMNNGELINITKKLNKKLSKTNGTFIDNFSNISFKGNLGSPLDLSIVIIHKMISENNNKIEKLQPEQIKKIFSTQNGVLVSRGSYYELNQKKFLEQIENGLDLEWDHYSSFINQDKIGMHIYLRPKSQSKNQKIFLDIAEKPLKALWQNNYRVYLDNYELIKSSEAKAIEEKMEKKATENGEDLIINNINNFSSTLQKTDFSETISTLSPYEKTLKWLDEKQWSLHSKQRPSTKTEIYNILNKIEFYKNDEKAKDAFFSFLKHTIQKNKINYHSNKESGYTNSFEGDFAEADSLVRAARTLKENKNVKNIRIEVLGKDMGDNKKQVPVDGKISFTYNNERYTCTFQSKSYMLSLLEKKMYKDASFTLSRKKNIDNNKHLKNLYAYPDTVLETGYNLMERYLYNRTDQEATKKILNPNIYQGAIPGLLRIKTYIGNDEVLNRSDFYFISGYYSPSFVFLKLLKQGLKEEGNMIKISSTTNKKGKVVNLVGILSFATKPIRVLDNFK